jgi:hypothetical protein
VGRVTFNAAANLSVGVVQLACKDGEVELSTRSGQWRAVDLVHDGACDESLTCVVQVAIVEGGSDHPKTMWCFQSSGRLSPRKSGEACAQELHVAAKMIKFGSNRNNM